MKYDIEFFESLPKMKSDSMLEGYKDFIMKCPNISDYLMWTPHMDENTAFFMFISSPLYEKRTIFAEKEWLLIPGGSEIETICNTISEAYGEDSSLFLSNGSTKTGLLCYINCDFTNPKRYNANGDWIYYNYGVDLEAIPDQLDSNHFDHFQAAKANQIEKFIDCLIGEMLPF